MPIDKVTVLGCGLMGSGIAQVCAQAGRQVTVVEVSEELLNKGISGINKNLSRLVEKGKLTAEARDQALGGLKGEADLDAAAGSDIVIEAIVESLPEKVKTY